MSQRPFVAYFSMEIALRSDLPSYSGGLGVLAGDTLRSSADLGLPVVGITLLHRQGYFRQQVDPEGGQRELPDPWRPEAWLEPGTPRVRVEIAGKQVSVRAWRSTSMCTGCDLRLAVWLRYWVGSTPWSSPRASEKTRHPSASELARDSNISD